MPNEYYPSDEAYVYALADALREEYLQVVEAGLILQVDDAFIPYNYDRMMLQGVSMEEYRKHCEMRIEAVNYALRGIPEDRIRYHICWGRGRDRTPATCRSRPSSTWCCAINAQAYSVEAANPRHEYEWKVWRDVEAAGRQDPDPRRGHAFHQRRRAPRDGRRADRALRQRGRSRERHRRHRLRLRAGLDDGAHAPERAVGQAPGAGGRGQAGLQPTVGRSRGSWLSAASRKSRVLCVLVSS